MPMFLKEFHKLWIGEKGSEAVYLYSGLSPSGNQVVTGYLTYNNEITTVFAKPLVGDEDKELEKLKRSVGFPETWTYQDFSIFTPSQQEEAAQVRGWLLDSPSEKNACQGIIMLLEGIDNKNAATNAGQQGTDLRE